MDYSWHNFTNVGYVSTSFTEEQLRPLKEEIQYIQNNFDNSETSTDNLVGHIKKEYKILKSKNYLQNLLYPLTLGFEKEYPIHSKNLKSNILEPKGVFLGPTWVNFQKKTEFNPVHNHSGLYSFVIWIHIPYDLQEEKNMFPHFEKEGKFYENKTSCFEFVYTTSLGSIQQHVLPVDKTYENKCILFPSGMNHAVYPFYTSDEYRISVSGNFFIKG
jgi:hypothetical protein